MVRGSVKFLAVVWLVLFTLATTALANQIFVDAAGRSVSIPDQVNHVMAAGPPAQVFLYSLAPDKLTAWAKEPSAADKAFLVPVVANLPPQGKLIAKDGTVNVAAITALKPDLIIDIGDVNARYADAADKVQKETGIPYILLDGHYAKTAESLRTAGRLLNVADRAERLAAYAEHVDADVKAAVQKATKRPLVYYGRGADGLETGQEGSINLEILDVVAAQNVAASLGKGGMAKVSEDQIAMWKPDVIIAETEDFFAHLKQDPAFTGVPAVQFFRLYHFPSSPFGWVDSPPSVNRLLGVKWLLAVVYPNRAAGDLSADTRAFYKLFYGVDLSDQQVQDFVKTAAPAK